MRQLTNEPSHPVMAQPSGLEWIYPASYGAFQPLPFPKCNVTVNTIGLLIEVKRAASGKAHPEGWIMGFSRCTAEMHG